jgi:hypothetical protein
MVIDNRGPLSTSCSRIGRSVGVASLARGEHAGLNTSAPHAN